MHSGSRFLFSVVIDAIQPRDTNCLSHFSLRVPVQITKAFYPLKGPSLRLDQVWFFFRYPPSFVSRRFPLRYVLFFFCFSLWLSLFFFYSLPSLYVSLVSLSFSSFLFQFLPFVFFVSIFLRLVCRCSLYRFLSWLFLFPSWFSSK